MSILLRLAVRFAFAMYTVVDSTRELSSAVDKSTVILTSSLDPPFTSWLPLINGVFSRFRAFLLRHIRISSAFVSALLRCLLELLVEVFVYTFRLLELSTRLSFPSRILAGPYSGFTTEVSSFYLAGYRPYIVPVLRQRVDQY